MLSPQTYYVEKKVWGGPVEPHLGCCKECFDQLKNVYNGKNNDKPKHAIANNKCFGYPPEELICLNKTELALVSQARVNRHMMNFTGGAHKCIKGWHNLYYNDLDWQTKVMNYYTKCEMLKRGEITESDMDEYENSINVVLTGPFTNFQRMVTKERVRVNPDKVITALKWLKANNRLYSNIDINKDAILAPQIIDCSEPVDSEDNNIESEIHLMAVFPDHAPANNEINGGHSTNQDMKDHCLEEISQDNQTLSVKPTKNILWDYKDESLPKAFPLHFPFGIGSYNDDVKSGAMGFYQYLNDLSPLHYQTAEFITIIHNMWERQKLFKKHVFTHPKKIKLR